MDHVMVVRVAERRSRVFDDRPGVAQRHAAAKLFIQQRIQ